MMASNLTASSTRPRPSKGCNCYQRQRKIPCPITMHPSLRVTSLNYALMALLCQLRQMMVIKHRSYHLDCQQTNQGNTRTRIGVGHILPRNLILHGMLPPQNSFQSPTDLLTRHIQHTPIFLRKRNIGINLLELACRVERTVSAESV